MKPVTGPRGECRPTDPIKSGTLVMRIAVGELNEDDARKIVEGQASKVSDPDVANWGSRNLRN